jgi:hypothetical protein
MSEKEDWEWILPTIRTMRDVGRIPAVERLVRLAETQIAASGDPDTTAALDDHRSWLAWAKAYEVEHGDESLLDRTHPVYLKVRQDLLEALERRRCRQESSDRVGR